MGSFLLINNSNQDYQKLQPMTSSILQPILQSRVSMSCQKVPHSDGVILVTKTDAMLDKQNISNSMVDEDGLDEEGIKKKNQNKQRYRRLKQKLATLCSEHQEKSLIKNNKDVSSPNKSRLLTLAIEFEKMTLNQTKDYSALETKMKQILKILDLKKEHDLFILKQSRFIPAFSTLLKKVPAFHKNEFFQAVKTVELGLKILRIFCSSSANRDYMITTNQLSTLNSCLTSFISKQQRKLSTECLTILMCLLTSQAKADSEQIVNVTLQIVLFGQLARKLRQGIQSCVSEQGTSEQEFILKSLQFQYLLYRKCFQKYLQRPLYQQPEIAQLTQFHLDALLNQLEHILPIILLEGDDGNFRSDDPPVCILNMCLFIFKLINLCAHVNYKATQKVLEISMMSQFWMAARKLFGYVLANLEDSDFDFPRLYAEILEFLGKMCCENQENRKLLNEIGIIQTLYNHPISYIMDAKLKSILIPTLCAVMLNCKFNIKKYLSQNSSDCIVNYITNHKKKYDQMQIIKGEDNIMQIYDADFDINQQKLQQQQKTASTRILSRKQSVSSLNSYTTQCTQNSYLPVSGEGKDGNQLFFIMPYSCWQPLTQELKAMDN